MRCEYYTPIAGDLLDHVARRKINFAELENELFTDLVQCRNEAEQNCWASYDGCFVMRRYCTNHAYVFDREFEGFTGTVNGYKRIVN